MTFTAGLFPINDFFAFVGGLDVRFPGEFPDLLPFFLHNTHFLCGGSHQKTLSAERGLWKQSCVSSRTAYTSAAIYSQHLWARPWKISRRRLWETWQRRWEGPCDFPAGSWETSAQGYFCTWVSLIGCVPSCSAGELEKSLPVLLGRETPPLCTRSPTPHSWAAGRFCVSSARRCLLAPSPLS